MSLQTRLTDLVTAIGTDYKSLKNFITGGAADLSALNTTDKSSIVGAINEVKAGATGSPPIASEAGRGVVELATLAEVAAGVDTERAVTVAGVRQERAAVKAEILGAGVPAALDTLDELAQALGDDANFAATVTAGLANRVRFDTAAQGLTTQEQTNARTNIGAIAASAIGDPETDLVAVYAAAKA